MGVQVFLWLTLLATLFHLDKFHLNAGDRFARGAAWLWLIVYIVDPPLLTLAYVRQVRLHQPDPARRHPTPPWFKAALALQAAITIGLGAALFLTPERSASVWPWPLTPLTGRAVAAWLLGLGLVLVWAVREGDWLRLRPATLSYTVLCILQLIALLRYHSELDPGWQPWAYVIFVVSIGALGACGLVGAHRAARMQLR